MLVKAWCYYESQRFISKSLKELFTHDLIVVLTIWIFSNYKENIEVKPIDHPFKALLCFLESFIKIVILNSNLNKLINCVITSDYKFIYMHSSILNT